MTSVPPGAPALLQTAVKLKHSRNFLRAVDLYRYRTFTVSSTSCQDLTAFMFLTRAEAKAHGHTCSLWGRDCLFNSERWVMTWWRSLWWRHRSWLLSLLTTANGPSPAQHSMVWIIDGDCPVYWREKLPYSHHVATYMQSCLVFPKKQPHALPSDSTAHMCQGAVSHVQGQISRGFSGQLPWKWSDPSLDCVMKTLDDIKGCGFVGSSPWLPRSRFSFSLCW